MSKRRSTTPYSDEYDLLIIDEEKRADQEARNGLLQFDEVLRLIEEASPNQQFELTPQLIAELNRLAIQGIRRSAGQFRIIPIFIEHTPHVPPPYEQVPQHVAQMCAYVNSNWRTRRDELADAIHISAYLMWRVNWIHPFRDGSGRTSRAVSYLAFGARLGQVIQGSPTIADCIVENKQPYYNALDTADAAWKDGVLDVSAMEALLSRLLEQQLSSAF